MEWLSLESCPQCSHGWFEISATGGRCLCEERAKGCECAHVEFLTQRRSFDQVQNWKSDAEAMLRELDEAVVLHKSGRAKRLIVRLFDALDVMPKGPAHWPAR